ncbi:hypothetical protein [Halobaculum sp. EA56]|uniref:hypothetical protein n=1 Tax=Halobaculum sp. EA56 TaxID=3421648 RepID=UPI003EB94D90
MPSIGTHLRVAGAVHCIVVLPAGAYVLATVVAWPLAVSYALTALPATLVGGIAPDVDHPSSHAYNLAHRWLPVLVGGSVLWASVLATGVLQDGFTQTNVSDTYALGVVSGVAAVSTWYTTRESIPKLRPPHRGIVHTARVGILFGTVFGAYITCLLWTTHMSSSPEIGTMWGAAFVIGYLSHLWRDGELSYQ